MCSTPPSPGLQLSGPGFIVVLPRPITHQLPYGSLLLIFTAGAITLSSFALYLRILFIGIAYIYFAATWVVAPTKAALRINMDAVGFALVATVAVLFVAFRISSFQCTRPR